MFSFDSKLILKSVKEPGLKHVCRAQSPIQVILDDGVAGESEKAFRRAEQWH